MVPRSHLFLVHSKQRAYNQNYYIGSMGPSPHLRFLLEKERLLDQNYKSLWVADITCGFVHSKQRL